MALKPGMKVGPYEVTAPLGAGGMGEVYRATDTKLGREVAIKVLAEGFTGDAERMARFEREARVLASLNHANTELFYRSSDQLMRVAVKAGSSFDSGRPAPLLDLPPTPREVQASYDVFPDGSFVTVASDPNAPPPHVIVVLNWLDELQRLVPTGD